MLPALHRLRQERAILAVTKRGATISSRWLFVQSLPQKDAPWRATIVVGKKLDKRAVVRNRIKRSLRAALQTHLRHISSGAQVVIRVRPPAAKASLPDLRDDLESLLRRARLLTHNP